MFNAQYKLTSPRVIETFFTDINLTGTEVLVRPEKLSVCKADQRYYFGLRDAKALKEKMPMALIHEAVGTVIYDPSGIFHKGDKVVLLPNIPGDTSRCAENYCLDSYFRSSRADGFMQEIMQLPVSQLVKYENIPEHIAAFTEFMSVGVHSVKTYISRRKNEPRRIGVWGDGGLGYIISALLKHYLPQTIVTVIGVQRSKLELFQFADEIHTIDEVSKNTVWFDDCFECVGGQPSEDAVSQMIDVIQPEGTIMLLGVSENPININTRMVLEKGLTLIGRSRSGRVDFEDTVKILETDKRFVNQMKKIVTDVVDVNSIEDINKAFDKARAADFKVVMNWNI